MTKLNSKKLRAVAELARFCVAHPELLDDTLLPQTLGIAIRKLHDFGECKLGKGKYLGHPYWSREARVLLEANSRKIEGIESSLSHEHVIPVSVVVKRLLSLPTKSSIQEFENEIRRLSLVAIIHRDQDASLRAVKISRSSNHDWIESDPWWRYREAKILSQIVDDSGNGLEV